MKDSITGPTYLGNTEKARMLKLIIPAIGEFLFFSSMYINLLSVKTQKRSDQPPKNDGENFNKMPLIIEEFSSFFIRFPSYRILDVTIQLSSF